MIRLKETLLYNNFRQTWCWNLMITNKKSNIYWYNKYFAALLFTCRFRQNELTVVNLTIRINCVAYHPVTNFNFVLFLK